jgi:hypothetical protein
MLLDGVPFNITFNVPCQLKASNQNHTLLINPCFTKSCLENAKKVNYLQGPPGPSVFATSKAGILGTIRSLGGEKNVFFGSEFFVLASTLLSSCSVSFSSSFGFLLHFLRKQLLNFNLLLFTQYFLFSSFASRWGVRCQRISMLKRLVTKNWATLSWVSWSRRMISICFIPSAKLKLCELFLRCCIRAHLKYFMW